MATLPGSTATAPDPPADGGGRDTAPTRVAVVTFPLDGPTRDDRPLLSADELERADRFRFARDRRRYTVGRATLRRHLGARCGTAPEEVEFSYGPQGKPRLADHPDVSFNLSHADDRALLVITDGTTVGVDIEPLRPGIASSGVAEQFFAPAEVAVLHAVAPAGRDRAFLECWTRKEAYLKAVGGGLSLPLDTFEVDFGPGRSARLLRSDTDPTDGAGWTLVDLTEYVPLGFVAALAVGRPAPWATVEPIDTVRIDAEQRGGP